MKNFDIGVGIQTNKINILKLTTIQDGYLKDIIDEIPLKFKVLCDTREKFVEAMTNIDMGHINEGVLLICTINFRYNKLTTPYVNYINKINMSQHMNWNIRQPTGSYYVTVNNKYFVHTAAKIVNIIKANSRLYKIDKLKTNKLEKIVIDYMITINEHNETYKLVITEDVLNMTFDEFKLLSKEESDSIIGELYHKDMYSKISTKVVSVFDNIRKNQP